MDARELTTKYYELSNELTAAKKQIDYLTQEFEKQRLIIEDMKIDLKMLEHARRN